MSSRRRKRTTRRYRGAGTSRRTVIQNEPWIIVLLGFLALPVAFYPWTFDPFTIPRVAALFPLTAAAFVGVRLKGGRADWRTPAFLCLGALAFAIALSWMASVDRRNAVLGNVGYRFGLTTWFGLLSGTALASLVVRSNETLAWLLRFGAAVLGIVSGYALVQTLGGDPFQWAERWDRPFSTLGNPNDLAAFGVLAIAFVGGVPAVHRRHFDWRAGAILAAATIVVVLSGSRSGVAALFLALLVAIGGCGLGRWPAVEQRRLAGTLGMLVLLGLVTAAVGGDLTDLSRRTADTFSESSTQGLYTRLSIWEGSFAAYRAHPVFGVGPDGLLSDFGRHQPVGLGYPFNQSSGTGQDPLVASPHSAPLELLVTAGPLALAAALALGCILAVQAWKKNRTGDVPAMPFLGAALAGFAAMASLNPLSVATAAVVAVLVGATLGLSSGEKTERTRVHGSRWARASLLGTLLVAAAALTFPVLAADTAAFQAAKASAHHDDASALRQADFAARLMPTDAEYARLKAQAAANVALAGNDTASVAEAERLQVRFLHRFAGLASDYVLLAKLRLITGSPGVDAALDAALRASPRGIETAAAVAALQQYRKGETER